MSLVTDDPETIEQRIYRALIVDEFGPDDVDWARYIKIDVGLEDYDHD